MGADRGVPGHLVLASMQSPAVTTSLRPCRWRGEAPEPRAGLASGHIPGSKTLQFANVLQDGRCVHEAAAQGRQKSSVLGPAHLCPLPCRPQDEAGR